MTTAVCRSVPGDRPRFSDSCFHMRAAMECEEMKASGAWSGIRQTQIAFHGGLGLAIL
jgi:hypothetical protein